MAVASVIAVGLVQPDYSGTADQQQTNDANAVADAGTASDAAGASATAQGSSRGGSRREVQVNHVTKYIHLKPGQTAPPGATVIYPGQPTPRVNVPNRPGPTSSAAPPSRNPTKPPAVHTPPPAVHTPPPPTPRPTNKTRQSGRP